MAGLRLCHKKSGTTALKPKHFPEQSGSFLAFDATELRSFLAMVHLARTASFLIYTDSMIATWTIRRSRIGAGQLRALEKVMFQEPSENVPPITRPTFKLKTDYMPVPSRWARQNLVSKSCITDGRTRRSVSSRHRRSRMFET